MEMMFHNCVKAKTRVAGTIFFFPPNVANRPPHIPRGKNSNGGASRAAEVKVLLYDPGSRTVAAWLGPEPTAPPHHSDAIIKSRRKINRAVSTK